MTQSWFYFLVSSKTYRNETNELNQADQNRYANMENGIFVKLSDQYASIYKQGVRLFPFATEYTLMQ